jgi:DNA-binding protein WhiA
LSFTVEVLEEIAKVSEEDSESLLAEFLGFLTVGGYIRLGSTGPELIIKASRPVSARRIIKTAKKLFNAEIGPLIQVENPFEKWYEISLKGNEIFSTLEKLGLLNGLNGIDVGVLEKLYRKKKQLINAFFRGIFLVGGYVQSPKQGRDLEIVVADEKTQQLLASFLKSERFKFGLRYRKHKYYLYLKNYDDIKDFLRRIGAQGSSFKFEDQQTINEMKNYVNRQVNFERANVQRVVNSSFNQLQDILVIDRIVGINNLTPALREAALLRLKYPELSLEELAKKTAGRLTKSGISHRLKRLHKLAEALKNQEGGDELKWQ